MLSSYRTVLGIVMHAPILHSSGSESIAGWIRTPRGATHGWLCSATSVSGSLARLYQTIIISSINRADSVTGHSARLH